MMTLARAGYPIILSRKRLATIGVAVRSRKIRRRTDAYPSLQSHQGLLV
jgi:hypothetical protein